MLLIGSLTGAVVFNRVSKYIQKFQKKFNIILTDRAAFFIASTAPKVGGCYAQGLGPQLRSFEHRFNYVKKKKKKKSLDFLKKKGK